MEKNIYVGFRTSSTERDELRKLAETRGYDSLSAYLRKLVEQDRAELVGGSQKGDQKPAGGGDLQGDLAVTLLELNRKLDRFFGHTFKATNVRSNYENLRNAVVALGLYQGDPAKLREYLKGLFKGEMEL